MIVPKRKITVVKNTGELEHLLRQRLYDNLITVFLPSGKSDLANILPLKKLLGDIPIILVLPDRKNNTITLGHKLHPRFITYTDSDFLDVATVLMKMKTNMETGGRYL